MARKNGSVAAKNRVILPPAKTGTISRIEARNALRQRRDLPGDFDGYWIDA